MSTKANPGPNNCYDRALPDEPLFTLLARDPDAPAVVRYWCALRMIRVNRGDAPGTDFDLVDEGEQCAGQMSTWRAENLGAWRDPQNFREHPNSCMCRKCRSVETCPNCGETVPARTLKPAPGIALCCSECREANQAHQ